MKNRIFVALLAGLLAPASAGDFNLNQMNLGEMLGALKASPAPVATVRQNVIRDQAYNDRFERDATFAISQRFDDLLTLGVKNYAETLAWGNCRYAGNNTCEVLLSRIDSCNTPVAGNQFQCKAAATAYAVQLPALYDRFDGWASMDRLPVDPSVNSDISRLEIFGTVGMALQRAMSQCRQSGNNHCVRADAGAQCPPQQDSCQATARVFGWKD